MAIDQQEAQRCFGEALAKMGMRRADVGPDLAAARDVMNQMLDRFNDQQYMDKLRSQYLRGNMSDVQDWYWQA